MRIIASVIVVLVIGLVVLCVVSLLSPHCSSYTYGDHRTVTYCTQQDGPFNTRSWQY